MKNKLLLGTSNVGKIKEFYFYLNHFNLFRNFHILSVNDLDNYKEPNENGISFEENAEIKSNHFFNLTKIPTISDDSGFVIKDLNNYPGVKTARTTKNLGGEQKVIDHIFSLFKDKKKLNASFYCALSFVNKEKKLIFKGKIDGFIIPQRRGNYGFGFDPYFIPINEKETYSEMIKDKKLISSHRFKAFNILANQIQLDNQSFDC